MKLFKRLIKQYNSLFCICFVLLCCVGSLFASQFEEISHASNFYVDLSKSSSNLQLSVYKNGSNILSKKIYNYEFDSFADCKTSNISLCKYGTDILCQINSDTVFFSFLFDKNGNLELSSGQACDLTPPHKYYVHTLQPKIDSTILTVLEK